MAGHMAALAVVVWSGRMHNILMQGECCVAGPRAGVSSLSLSRARHFPDPAGAPRACVAAALFSPLQAALLRRAHAERINKARTTLHEHHLS